MNQNEFYWLERYVRSKPTSVEHDITEDKLKEYGVIPDNDPKLAGEDYQKFWKQFK